MTDLNPHPDFLSDTVSEGLPPKVSKIIVSAVKKFVKGEWSPLLKFLEENPKFSLVLSETKALDGLLPHILADMIRQKKLSYAGEGKEGRIYSFSVSSLPKWQQKMLGFYSTGKVSISEDCKFKFFKLGKPGAQNEFEMQQRAGNLLRGQGADFAIVPAVFFYKKVAVAGLRREIDDVDWLRNISAENLELICGEYVPGIDFATYLYSEILKKLGKPVPQTFDDLQQALANAFNLERTWEQNPNAQAIYTENANEIWQRAEALGVELPKIAEPLRKTLKFLNERDCYHNDLHDRNVIVGQNNTVAIIDFGLAGTTRPDGVGDLGFVMQLEKYRTAEQRKIEAETGLAEQREAVQVQVKKILLGDNQANLENPKKGVWTRRLVEGFNKQDAPIQLPDGLPENLKGNPSSDMSELITSLSNYATLNRQDALTYIFCTLRNNGVDSQVPLTQACKNVLLTLYSPTRTEKVPGLGRGPCVSGIMDKIPNKDIRPLALEVIAKIDPIAALEYLDEHASDWTPQQRIDGYQAIRRGLGIP